MSFYIGIDGGGSKTKCVLCDDSLKIISETHSGPSNFLTLGTDKVSETIKNLLTDCCESQKLSLSQINSIVLGTTGAGRTSDAENLENAIKYKLNKLSVRSFHVVSDARIALEGAFSGNPGSILIAGTGSIMYGKDIDGIIHRVGGFGRLIGDEGSGLTLGRKGLNVLAKYLDGRGSSSSLINKIKKRFNINDQNQLISKVYNNGLLVQDVTPLVLEAAAEGDELCNKILDEETNELLLHIVAMTKKMNIENMKVAFIGGTISNENSYSKMLIEKVKLFLPKIIIQHPDNPPEIGAVILAINIYNS